MGTSGKVNQYWELLDETAALLNRTAVKSRFEKQLAAIALRSQSDPANPANLKEVYGALTELRKQMRLLGYDLSMGKYTLFFDGFRNDEAYGHFTRMVLVVDQNGVFYWNTGDNNHVTLYYLLEDTIKKTRRIKQLDIKIMDRHYLWFEKTRSTLTLSGSATETVEAYDRLKKIADADNLLFLSRLKGLL
jgi:ribosomal protein L10